MAGESDLQPYCGNTYKDLSISGNARVHLGNNYYAAPERPETPPAPLCLVPFPRDEEFLDHSHILESLKDRLDRQGARVALVGIGGVGKSQFAVEYAYRLRERSPHQWIFWIDAANTSAFESSVRATLDALKVPGRANAKADIPGLLRNWLLDERKGSWLMVLDNVEDIEYSASSPDRTKNTVFGNNKDELIHYIPPVPHGAVLVTSRTKHAALRIVKKRNLIEVGTMDRQSATDLLARKLGTGYDESKLGDLAVALDCMPLALVQSAAYINQRAPRFSVSNYLLELQKGRDSKIELLDRGEGDPCRGHQVSSSVLSTWQISFEHIRSLRSSAADLLALMSFFDGQNIPDCILEGATSWTESLSRSNLQSGSLGLGTVRDLESENSNSAINDAFEEDIVVLKNYSFVSITKDPSVFKVHALLQLSMQRWLITRKQYEHWELQFVSRLEGAFPKGRFFNWAMCRRLYPHAKSAADIEPVSREAALHWAELMYHLGCHAAEVGALADMKRFAGLSAGVRNRLLGPIHQDTLWSSRLVASATAKTGDFQEAERMCLQLMETSKTTLDPRDRFSTDLVEELAGIYTDTERWTQAEELTRGMLEMHKELMGPEAMPTLRCMGRLALILHHQQQWSASGDLYTQITTIAEQTFQDSHPDILVLRHNHASLYSAQNRWAEAEILHARVLSIQRKRLGDGHLQTLICWQNLAGTLYHQGKFGQAEAMYGEVLEASTRAFGEQHAKSLAIARDLASCRKMSARARTGPGDEGQARAGASRGGLMRRWRALVR